VSHLLSGLLAAVTVLLGAVLVWSAWRTRRDFVTAPGAFRCNLRLRSAQVPGILPTWYRSQHHAVWIHDVLVIRSGLLRPQTRLLPVHMAEGGLVELGSRSVPGLGRHPISVTVQLDDHEEIELAAAGEHRSLLVGPFVVIAVGRLPGQAPPG
jgi:hypothetical protein